MSNAATLEMGFLALWAAGTWSWTRRWLCANLSHRERHLLKQMNAETLRRWLDEGRTFTVLDIRTDEQRAEWLIPGGCT